MKPVFAPLGRCAWICRAGAFAVFAMALVPFLRAHDAGLSTAQARWRADGLEIVVGVAPADASTLLSTAERPAGAWTAEDFRRLQPALERVASQWWEAKAEGAPLAPRERNAELAAGDAVNFRVVFPRPERGSVTLRALQLGALPAGHREFMLVLDERGSTLAQKLLNAKDDTLLMPVPAGGRAEENTSVAPGTGATFRAFLKLGVEHIWTGYDHLLFLFALLVVCRTFRSIVAIITCFTLAHSLTLALATFELVALPGRVIEPLIAASIVFVGLENLWRRGEEPRGRWALTFAFGLIHGFGFAGVLRELGLGAAGSGVALPLFTFNLGVELGQIAIAAVVLPLVWRLRRHEAFVRRGVPALSALVAAAGLYWLVERVG